MLLNTRLNMHAHRSLWQRVFGLLVVVLAACGGSDGGSDSPIPTASIIVPVNVAVNSVLTVVGSGSTTGSGTVTYRWTLTSKPAGSAAVLSDVTVAQPTIVPDLIGIYAFSLTVSDGFKNTIVSGSTTAIVAAPPTITSDIVEPLSGSVQLGLSSDPSTYVVTWTVDGTAIGTGSPLAWDSTTVGNGSHVVAAHVSYLGNYAVDVTRTFQVAQTTVVFSNSAVSTTTGQLTGIVTAASANGIVRVSATLDGVAIGSLAAPNACTDSTGAACATTGLNGFSFSGAVVAGAHVMVITATDGVGNSLGIQLRLTTT